MTVILEYILKNFSELTFFIILTLNMEENIKRFWYETFFFSFEDTNANQKICPVNKEDVVDVQTC